MNYPTEAEARREAARHCPPKWAISVRSDNRGLWHVSWKLGPVTVHQCDDSPNGFRGTISSGASGLNTPWNVAERGTSPYSTVVEAAIGVIRSFRRHLEVCAELDAALVDVMPKLRLSSTTEGKLTLPKPMSTSQDVRAGDVGPRLGVVRRHAQRPSSPAQESETTPDYDRYFVVTHHDGCTRLERMCRAGVLALLDDGIGVDAFIDPTVDVYVPHRWRPGKVLVIKGDMVCPRPVTQYTIE